MHKVTTLKSLSIIFAFTFLLNTNFVVAKYSGGDGTKENPWKISSKEDLLALGANIRDYNDCFLMTNDINMGGDVYTTSLIAPYLNISNGTVFGGRFDGNGFKITGLTIVADVNNGCLGLFGYINGGEIRNLGMEEVCIDGKSCHDVGTIAGFIINCNISFCYSTGSVIAERSVGGLVGDIADSNIKDCYSLCSVEGTECTGGLIGCNAKSKIINSHFDGEVCGDNKIGGLVGWNYYDSNIINCYSIGTVWGMKWNIGGLVGENIDANISRSYSNSNVTVINIENRSIKCVGGLVGSIRLGNNNISDCYATGDINIISDASQIEAGGLAGSTSDCNISNCYSTCDLDVTDGWMLPYCDIGGFIGSNRANVSNCFWNIETQSHGITEGMGSSVGTTTNVIALTTAQMQQKVTYTSANWDFIKTWAIGENQTYPYLRQTPTSDINQDNKVDYFDLAVLVENWLSRI